MRTPHLYRVARWTCAVVLAVGAAIGPAPAAPPHLEILSAEVEELPPILQDGAPDRAVALRIELAAAVPAPCTPGAQVYGFLIDVDTSSATGLVDPAFDDLGVDARIAASCDPSGTFTGPPGTTVVISGPSANVLEILTNVKSMPSLEFDWVAYAHEGTLFTRLPEAPAHGHWSILELALW